MNSVCKYGVLAIGMLCFLGITDGWAQINVQHQQPTLVERGSQVELAFDLPGIPAGDVAQAILFYRYDGDNSYSQMDVRFRQNKLYVPFSVQNQNANTLEYYLNVSLVNGSQLTFPENTPSDNPVVVEIVDEREEETTERTGTNANIEYTILSPEPNQQVAKGEVLVALTLFYEDESIDPSQFALFFDGEDVTESSDISAYFISYVPEDLTYGNHDVRLELKEGKKSKRIAAWKFEAVDENELALDRFADEGSRNRSLDGQVELVARNQRVFGDINDAYRGNFRVNGKLGAVRFSANGLLTSQEDPRLQPQNRFGAELYFGNWLEVQAGHIFPTLTPMSMAGRRLFGVNTGLHILNRNFNVQFMYGELSRDINSIYTPLQVQEEAITIGTDTVSTQRDYSMGFGDQGVGTFTRELMGARVAFGNGEKFQLGFHGLTIEDQVGSIQTINTFEDFTAAPQSLQNDLLSGLSATERQQFYADSTLSLNGSNPQAKGNFVGGADLTINMFKNKFRLKAEAGASLLNEDISAGVLNADRAADLGFELDQSTSDLLESLSFLIVVNEQMSTLPFRFVEDPDDPTQSTFEPFVPMGIFGGQSEASLNVLNNDIRVQYRWIGPDYETLANTTIRQDLAGFTISDRFRLFNNRVYLTAGYERLEDNVINTRPTTTVSTTLRGNLSWFPVKQSLPRVSVGARLNNRDNNLPFSNFILSNESGIPETAGIRNISNQSGGIEILNNARATTTNQYNASITQRFNLFGINNQASLSYVLLNTIDDAFAYGDIETRSLSFNIENRFNRMPLNTRFGINMNNSTAVSGLTDIEIFGVTAGASIFLFDEKLTINGSVNYTSNTSDAIPLTIDTNDNTLPDGTLLAPEEQSYDDFFTPNPAGRTVTESNLYVFQAGARYLLSQNHAFQLDMNFNNVVSQTGNTLPNDRIIQARYIYRF